MKKLMVVLICFTFVLLTGQASFARAENNTLEEDSDWSDGQMVIGDEHPISRRDMPNPERRSDWSDGQMKYPPDQNISRRDMPNPERRSDWSDGQMKYPPDQNISRRDMPNPHGDESAPNDTIGDLGERKSVEAQIELKGNGQNYTTSPKMTDEPKEPVPDDIF